MKDTRIVSLSKYVRSQFVKLLSVIIAAICLVGFTAAENEAFASAPFAKTQAPGFYRTMVGDFEITALLDGTSQLPMLEMLQGDKEEIKNLLAKSYLGESVETSINEYLINTGSKLILVDAGGGSLLGPAGGSLIQNLRAAGYKPEQVDEILITHMHADHVGGLVNNANRVFPNATVYVEKHEADYWLNEDKMNAAPTSVKPFFQAAISAVKPYIDANKFKTFEGNFELMPGIHAESAFGHTPGHAVYVAESKGKKIVLLGDVVHVAAVQFADPSVTFTFDSNAEEAAFYRQRLFSQAANNRWLIGGAHLSFPGVGHIHSEGNNSYVFIPLNYAAIK